MAKPLEKRVSLEELAETIPFSKPEDGELFQAVMRLPEKHRTVLYLFYYEGYSVKEIAQICRLTSVAVRTRLSRGRDKLKEMLLKEDAL